MRSNKNDYAPYYERYINLVKKENIHKILATQSIETQAVLNSFPKAMGDYSYEKGKWTVKEVVGHLIDTERVMAYRACVLQEAKSSHCRDSIRMRM